MAIYFKSKKRPKDDGGSLDKGSRSKKSKTSVTAKSSVMAGGYKQGMIETLNPSKQNPRRAKQTQDCIGPRGSNNQRNLRTATASAPTFSTSKSASKLKALPASKKDLNPISRLNRAKSNVSAPSDSESSDSSSSDNSSSSDSEASDSDSDSDSDSSISDTHSLTKLSRKTPPGDGSRQTKARNARRRIAREKFALAQKLEGTPAGAATSAPSSTPASAASKPKVVMTTVELRDHESVSRTSRPTPTKGRPKLSSGSAYNTRSKDASAARDILVAAPSDKSVIAENMSTELDIRGDEERGASQMDYDALAKLEGYPSAGDKIAFKEATVEHFSEADMVAKVVLAPRSRKKPELDSEGQPILGKLDIYDEDEHERAMSGVAFIDWITVHDCRVVAMK
ncbi:hypothetical protein BGZ98_003325 [Dissophora globulifera]|nr:hypothetical protein BGZ98_003325 [Dissophora globulifera]